MSPKLANMQKGFVVDLRRPRQLDHPLIGLIIKKIIAEESKGNLYSSSDSYTYNYNYSERVEYELTSVTSSY
jgi:hypothetical protein